MCGSMGPRVGRSDTTRSPSSGTLLMSKLVSPNRIQTELVPLVHIDGASGGAERHNSIAKFRYPLADPVLLVVEREPEPDTQ